MIRIGKVTIFTGAARRYTFVRTASGFAAAVFGIGILYYKHGESK